MMFRAQEVGLHITMVGEKGRGTNKMYYLSDVDDAGESWLI